MAAFSYRRFSVRLPMRSRGVSPPDNFIKRCAFGNATLSTFRQSARALSGALETPRAGPRPNRGSLDGVGFLQSGGEGREGPPSASRRQLAVALFKRRCL